MPLVEWLVLKWSARKATRRGLLWVCRLLLFHRDVRTTWQVAGEILRKTRAPDCAGTRVLVWRTARACVVILRWPHWWHLICHHSAQEWDGKVDWMWRVCLNVGAWMYYKGAMTDAFIRNHKRPLIQEEDQWCLAFMARDYFKQSNLYTWGPCTLHLSELWVQPELSGPISRRFNLKSFKSPNEL